jgi:hypothetical protein
MRPTTRPASAATWSRISSRTAAASSGLRPTTAGCAPWSAPPAPSPAIATTRRTRRASPAMRSPPSTKMTPAPSGSAPAVLARLAPGLIDWTSPPARSPTSAMTRTTQPASAATPLPASSQDRSGALWVGAGGFSLAGAGLNRSRPRDGRVHPLPPRPERPDEPGQRRGHCPPPRQSGRISGSAPGAAAWIGWRRTPQGVRFVHHRHDPYRQSSISADIVWSMLEDRSGVYWFGTINGGLKQGQSPGAAVQALSSPSRRQQQPGL